MPIHAERRRWHDAAQALLPTGTDVWDAHCHTGDADPDGVAGSDAKLLERLDRAGHAGAVIMPSRDPRGYPAANNRILAESQASGGRLLPFLRIDPHAPGALAEAERSLDVGHCGVKLHPRGEAFPLSHPVVHDVARLAAERRVPVLVHSGRGIPPLREDLLRLLETAPGVQVILAHCGISDLARLGPEADHLPGVYFDTAWWDVTDLLALFAWVPPGRILYASDTPYGRPAMSFTRTMRVAAAAGLDEAAMRSVFGGTLHRLLAGDEGKNLGGPAGDEYVIADPGLLRVYASLHGAIVELFAGGDAAEPISLARLGCDVDAHVPHAEVYRALAQGLDLAADPAAPRRGRLGLVLTLAAAALTPQVPVPP